MPTDPITAAIRRTIAAAEPMWRDTAIDKLTGEIAQAVRAETPHPATTDDAAGGHLALLRQRYVGLVYADALDTEVAERAGHEFDQAIATALTAAGAGEAWGGWSEGREAAIWEVLREHGVSTGSLDDTIARDLIAAATKAGTEVDREALAMKAVRAWSQHRRWRAVVDAVLAARGDAATPTEVEVQWGWRLRPTPSVEPRDVLCESEAEAREPVYGKIAVLRREVHRAAGSWQEVTP